MPDYDRQKHDGGFRLNFVAITIVHLLMLGGLLLVSLSHPSKKEQSIVWINPGSFGANPATGETASAGSPEPTPPPSEEVGEAPSSEPEKSPEAPTPTLPEPTFPPPESTPPPTAAELPLPTPTALATPRPTPKPSPSPTPNASPIPKLKPSPTPKVTPKATPSPTSSATSKPSPNPSPKPSVTPKPTHKPESTPKEKEKPEAETSPKPKAPPAKPDDKNKSKASPSPSAHFGEAKNAKSSNGHSINESSGVTRTNGGEGHGAGSGSDSGDSALAAYVGILTNRFQAAWNQPTGEMAMGKTLEVTVKLKVEADGRVTEFTIIEGSGNAVVDESVREAGKRITRLPPPPNNEAFSAPVRFELGN